MIQSCKSIVYYIELTLNTFNLLVTNSSFFRLETLFLTFFALLYYIINQLFTYPFYTNRPRFV